PQDPGAMYPHFIREQRTKLEILSRKRMDDTPGPATYNVDAAYKALLPSSRSFTIQGIRRPKNHENGPFATL
ncbi:hypothetical protein N300_08001, partial [Calypte anna]